uniref:BACK domain-containing protein n=1 Tax=Macrostomum lignano TaxID=282301 RepID=A0A1I8F7P4_9PLAT
MDYSSSGKMLVSVKKQRRSIVLTPALIASANNPMCDAAQNSIVRNNLRRQTLSRMFEAVDSGLLTSDVKRGFLEFASTTDLVMLRGEAVETTCARHAVQVPAFSGEGGSAITALDLFLAQFKESLWPQLEFDMVHRLLSHPGINCSSELAVLDAALRWLDVDCQSGQLTASLCCPAFVLSAGSLLKSFPNVPPNLLDVYRSKLGQSCIRIHAAGAARGRHAVPAAGAKSSGRGRLPRCSIRARQHLDNVVTECVQTFERHLAKWSDESTQAALCSSSNWRFRRRERALNTVSLLQLKDSSRLVRGLLHDLQAVLRVLLRLHRAAKCSQLAATAAKRRTDAAADWTRWEKTSVDDNSWLPVASMRTVRSDAGAAALNGRIYVAGGFNGQQYHDTAGSLRASKEATCPQRYSRAASMVMGGWSDQPTQLAFYPHVEKFNTRPQTAPRSSWQICPTQRRPRRHAQSPVASLIKRYLGNQLLRASNPWHVAASPAAAGEAGSTRGQINSEPEGSN